MAASLPEFQKQRFQSQSEDPKGSLEKFLPRVKTLEKRAAWDGVAYTKQEFVDWYGWTRGWKEALRDGKVQSGRKEVSLGIIPEALPAPAPWLNT